MQIGLFYFAGKQVLTIEMFFIYANFNKTVDRIFLALHDNIETTWEGSRDEGFAQTM